MIPEYPELLYKKLQSELDRIGNLRLPEEKTLEECFGISMSLEQKLVNWVSRFIFDSEEDEIQFFKVTRPKFTSHIHHFKKRYNAVLFQPHDQVDQIAFFEYEIDKAERFLAENAGFYQYYKSGQTFNDRSYFVRSCVEDAGPAHPCRSETGYDLLIANFQGLEMYKNFVQDRLQEFRATHSS